MDSTTSQSFLDELTKIALTPKTIQKMLMAAKKKQIRKGMASGVGYGYSAPKKDVSRDLGKLVSGMGAEGDEAVKVRSALQGVAEASPLYGWGGKILTPEAGDATRLFRNVPEEAVPGLPKALSKLKSPKQRKALEGVVKGHELAESQVKPTTSFGQYGHRSPDVILREHNMIQTLPKGMKRAAEPMRKLREAGGEAGALREATGFEFGKGQRISRHARKRLTEMYEKAQAPKMQEGLKELRAQLGAMK